MAGAGWGARKQHIAALECRTLVDKTHQLRYIPRHLCGRSFVTNLAIDLKRQAQFWTRRREFITGHNPRTEPCCLILALGSEQIHADTRGPAALQVSCAHVVADCVSEH